MWGWKKKSKLDAATFCVYPWIEQVVQPTGKVSFCCVAKNGGLLKKPDGQYYSAAEDRLAAAWNSEHMRKIRQGMLAGEKVSGCELCYFQESIGKNSYRQMHNDEWLKKDRPDIEERVQSSIDNQFRVEKPALYLDLRLGNLCNLKCRSCNPYNSSQIHKEVTQLMDTDADYLKFWTTKHRESKPASYPNWYESDAFWDEVIESIPNLRKVYLTGGEPTLIEKNYRFLQACIDSGHSKHIFLMFNTNCTNIQDRFLKLLPHFEFVLINASIDGLGPVNDYIRFLSRWETIDKNFRRLVGLADNVKIGITPVVQVYNILNIVDLLRYVESVSLEANSDINVDFLYATDPPYINPQILPYGVKAEAVRRLEAYKRDSKTYHIQSYLKNSVDSCINMLNESPQADLGQLTDFAEYTRLLDKHRKQSFAGVFPELSELLAREVTDVHV